MSTMAGWTLATLGLLVGLLMAPIPGLSGAVVACLGVACLAVLSGWTVVPPAALLVVALLALASGVAQGLAPVWGVRSVSSATGAATGAVVFGALGLLVPLPFVALGTGTLGAVVGAFVGGGSLGARVAVPAALVPGLTAAVLADAVAVFGIAAVVGVGSHLAG